MVICTSFIGRLRRMPRFYKAFSTSRKQLCTYYYVNNDYNARSQKAWQKREAGQAQRYISVLSKSFPHLWHFTMVMGIINFTVGKGNRTKSKMAL